MVWVFFFFFALANNLSLDDFKNQIKETASTAGFCSTSIAVTLLTDRVLLIFKLFIFFKYSALLFFGNAVSYIISKQLYEDGHCQTRTVVYSGQF